MTITRLNPFEPCTPAGLADELWKLNCEISDANKALAVLRGRRDHIQGVLLEAMQKHGLAEIEGDHPVLRLTDGWDYDLYAHTGKRIPVLEFEKERKS